jgi:hypothetical protein
VLDVLPLNGPAIWILGLSVLTLLVVPGTGCSMALTDPASLLRPEAGRMVAEEELEDAGAAARGGQWEIDLQRVSWKCLHAAFR